MSVTTIQQDRARRELMERFISRTGWSFVLRPTAQSRWGRDVVVRIAEKGTFRGVPVKGWTHTDTGTIFMREEIFDGIDLDDPDNLTVIRYTIDALIHGTPINPLYIRSQIPHRSKDEYARFWKIAQTVVANYGVFGHEYCHAAYSDHAARNSWLMGLEDLRAENFWMAQDPIRARQGLRACASFWVTHDTSPMAGERALDLSKITNHASLLHLYLLIVGRGRIGVLDDQSMLVTGIRRLAESVLGWETVSDADDIIDRFLETSEDLDDADGPADRAALAKEFADLLPKEAGDPGGDIGCGCDPRGVNEDEPGDPGDGEDEPGDGQTGSEGDEGDEGEGAPEDGEGAPGDEPGEDEGEGDETGGSGSGDEDGEEGDSDASGGGGRAGDEGDEDADEGAHAGGSGEDGEDDEDGDDGLTVASNKGGDNEDGGKDGSTDPVDADFHTGTYGETVRPTDDHATDALDQSGAYQLTTEQVEELNEVLSDGLEEVSNSESEAGWAISDSEGAIITSRSTSPAKVSGEVFSRQALITRNRRVRTR